MMLKGKCCLNKKETQMGLFLGSDSERAASAFNNIQLQRLEQSAISRLPVRQKAPLRQELQ